MRLMSTQERARAVYLVQAGRSLREVCISWLHKLFLITIFALTVLKINKAYLKSLRLLQVARDFNRDHKTISRLVRKFQRTGSVEDLPRTPKRRVTTRQQDRYIRLTHLRDRNLTTRTTARNTIGRYGRLLSDQTIHNRIREGGLPARQPYIGLVLSARHRQLPLAWARRHLSFRLGSDSFYRRV